MGQPETDGTGVRCYSPKPDNFLVGFDGLPFNRPDVSVASVVGVDRDVEADDEF